MKRNDKNSDRERSIEELDRETEREEEREFVTDFDLVLTGLDIVKMKARSYGNDDLLRRLERLEARLTERRDRGPRSPATGRRFTSDQVIYMAAHWPEVKIKEADERREEAERELLKERIKSAAWQSAHTQLAHSLSRAAAAPTTDRNIRFDPTEGGRNNG